MSPFEHPCLKSLWSYYTHLTVSMETLCLVLHNELALHELEFQCIFERLTTAVHYK